MKELCDKTVYDLLTANCIIFDVVDEYDNFDNFNYSTFDCFNVSYCYLAYC